MRKINLALIILVGLINFVSAHAGESHTGDMMGMYGAYGGTGMIFGWVFYLLVIVLIIAAIYWLIKSANSKNRRR